MSRIFRISRNVISILALAVIVSSWPGCTNDHSHDGQEQEHKPHGSNGDVQEALPAQSVTIWTQKTELFMEYEPLVAGRPSRFAAHLTTVDDFKAVTSGALVLNLRFQDGSLQQARAEKPSSPGIFRFTVTPEKAGTCEIVLSYGGQGITDTIQAGTGTVYADEAAARAVLPKESEGGIAYTKELQWKTDFETIRAGLKQIQPSVRAIGEISPASGREARLTAPVRGRITLPEPTPLQGVAVKKGQVLAIIAPFLAAGGDRSTLEAEVRSAKAELSAAEAQFARLERLFKEQAIPERRLEDGHARVSVAKAKLAAASGRLKQYSQGATGLGHHGPGAFELRSAIDGTLVQVNVTTGDSVEEGQLLFVVMDLSRIWLVARIFEPEIPKVESATSAWFTVEGYHQPFTIDKTNARLITVGHVIDPKSRTVPVVFEMENPGGKLRIGQFAEIFIATGEPRESLVLPVSALLTDGGKKIAFIQTEGETFERRVLKTGIRYKDWIEVISGISVGERVVTRGAYEVRLAAASGAIPESGHVH